MIFRTLLEMLDVDYEISEPLDMFPSGFVVHFFVSCVSNFSILIC